MFTTGCMLSEIRRLGVVDPGTMDMVCCALTRAGSCNPATEHRAAPHIGALLAPVEPQSGARSSEGNGALRPSECRHDPPGDAAGGERKGAAGLSGGHGAPRTPECCQDPPGDAAGGERRGTAGGGGGRHEGGADRLPCGPVPGHPELPGGAGGHDRLLAPARGAAAARARTRTARSPRRWRWGRSRRSRRSRSTSSLASCRTWARRPRSAATSASSTSCGGGIAPYPPIGPVILGVARPGQTLDIFILGTAVAGGAWEI